MNILAPTPLVVMLLDKFTDPLESVKLIDPVVEVSAPARVRPPVEDTVTPVPAEIAPAK